MEVGEEKEVTVSITPPENGTVNVTYKVSDKHRNTHNSNASYWIASPDDEYDLFVTEWLPCWYTLPNCSIERVREGRQNKNVIHYKKGVLFGEEQFLPKDAFALRVVNNSPIVVGRTKVDNRAKGNNAEDNRSDTIFARFEADSNTHNKKWHGYPAAPNLNDHDIPDSCYLKYWVKQGYLTKAQIKRMLSKLPKKR